MYIGRRTKDDRGKHATCFGVYIEELEIRNEVIIIHIYVNKSILGWP